MANFFSTPKGKRITGVAYGLGASVVIVGALFKIQHYPGAGAMLMVGMLIEACLFAISAFEDPHKEYHWEKVYPQLADGEAVTPAAGASKAVSKGNTIDEIAQAGSMSVSDAQRLNEGIKRLSESANQIADVTAAVSATSNYARNMNAASDAISSFAATQSNLKSSSDSLFASYKTVAESMGAVANDAQDYMKEMQGITKNLSSINAGYEMQVKGMTSQVDMINGVTENMKKVQDALNSAANESTEFKSQLTKLTQQLNSLNSIYGNMLGAFNVNR
ncbi:MAG: gliding motility protein GldL [Paludibacteraceae bacterium]|nr:gliding motility protein GldL [Paludibacteraceae bacterium]